MKGTKRLLLVYVILIAGFGSAGITYGQEIPFRNKSVNNVPEQEYYYALGEATKLFLFGNFAQAVNLYQECIKLQPESSASHFQLAKIFRQAGELNLAKKHAKAASTFAPENKWYLEELANVYQLDQKYDSAILVYEQILKKEPESLGIIFMIASLYERTGKYDQALEYLARIEQKVGPTKETAVSKYRIYDSMKLEQRAEEQLKFALSLSEEDYSLLGMLAEFYREYNKPDSAFLYYRKIYPAYKTDAVVVFSYAEFLLEQQRVDTATSVMLEGMKEDAIDNFSKTRYLFKVIQDDQLFKLTRPVIDTVVGAYLNKYNDDVRAMSVYADIEFRIGNYQKSAGALKRIIDADSRNYPAYEQLIYCENASQHTDSVLKYSYLAMANFPEQPLPYLFSGSANYLSGDYKTAVIRLESGLKRTDNESLKIEFYSLLAECYMKLENFEKSDENFQLALDIDEDNLGIRNNYAYYLAVREKNLSYARTLSKSTIKAEPKNSTYLDTYGWVLYKMGKLGGARKYISMAMQYGGAKNSEILLHYGEILMKMKKDQEAVAIWKQALEFAGKDQITELQNKLAEAEQKVKR